MRRFDAHPHSPPHPQRFRYGEDRFNGRIKEQMKERANQGVDEYMSERVRLIAERSGTFSSSRGRGRGRGGSLIHCFTPSLIDSFTPSLLRSFTPSLLGSLTPSPLHSKPADRPQLPFAGDPE